MTKSVRSQYTLEFKQEAVRLVQSGQSLSSVNRSLGVAVQTLHNWVKRDAAQQLVSSSNKPAISAEQMEISRLKAELSKVKIERDILKKATAYFAKDQL